MDDGKWLETLSELGGLPKLVFEKICRAVGMVYEPTHVRHMARAKGDVAPVANPRRFRHTSRKRPQPGKRALCGVHPRRLQRRRHANDQLSVSVRAVEPSERGDGDSWRDKDHSPTFLARRDHVSLPAQGVSTDGSLPLLSLPYRIPVWNVN